MRLGVRTALLICSAALLGAAAEPPSSMDSETLRSHIRAAYGANPSNTISIVDWQRLDGTFGGSETRYMRNTDWREVDIDGPFHTESGSVKGEHWHQDANGITVIDAPSPGHAAEPVRTTTVTRDVQTGNWVLTTLDTQGFGSREDVDPVTYHVLRDVQITANGKRTTTYDTFRTVGGRTQAWHWLRIDDVSQTKTEYTRREYSVDTATEDDVAETPIRRELVEFPAGVERVTLPGDVHSDRIYVRVTINGRGLDFILDTGASGIFLDSDVAKQLGLPRYDERSQVAAGRIRSAETIIPEMHIGSLTMRNIDATLIPDAEDEYAGVRPVGLLGFDFLATLGVTIDFDNHNVAVEPGNRFEEPTERHFVLPIRLNGEVPTLSAVVNGVAGDNFMLDTGAPNTFAIFQNFAHEHPAAMDDHLGLGARTRRQEYSGVGGALDLKQVAIEHLVVGPLNFHDFVGHIVNSKQSFAGYGDGLVGLGFFNNFTISLDYPHGAIYLVPNARGRANIVQPKKP